MLEYGEGRSCSICGAPITDNNPDGIGFGCREAYKKASWKVFFQDSKRRSAYYYAKNDPIVETFLSELKNTKFRSSFWKGFYPSVKQQWTERKFVSAKQIEIMENRLYRDGFPPR